MAEEQGFWDSFEDTTGTNFVGKEEKAVLAETEAVIPIKRIAKGQSKFGPRYLVFFDQKDEERTLSFSAESVESRDRTLDAMIEFLAVAEEGSTVDSKLVLNGRSYILTPAA